TAGEPVVLAFRERKPRRTKLALLCDVSGSMDLYARLLLQFLYAMQNEFGRVETFVFGTRLSRVTEQLRAGVYREALECLARDVQDWSGGTRIGECIAAFEAGWPRLVDGRTAVIVLSDGWDTGEPEGLAGALVRIRRRARRLSWLNPLLGSPGYQPLTRGMQAALPHVDVSAPAADLGRLAGLARRLVGRAPGGTPMDSSFTALDRMRGAAHRVALATLVATRGTAPKKEGARMWVDEEGRIVGAVTIGGCVDA